MLIFSHCSHNNGHNFFIVTTIVATMAKNKHCSLFISILTMFCLKSLLLEVLHFSHLPRCKFSKSKKLKRPELGTAQPQLVFTFSTFWDIFWGEAHFSTKCTFSARCNSSKKCILSSNWIVKKNEKIWEQAVPEVVPSACLVKFYFFCFDFQIYLGKDLIHVCSKSRWKYQMIEMKHCIYLDAILIKRS